MAKKFFVDTIVANELGNHLIPLLKDLFGSGYVAVVSDAAVDIRDFQDAIGWTEEQIEEGRLIVEAFYDSLDCLTEKPFTWSSRNVTTPEAISFHEATKAMTFFQKRIELLADLIDRSCLERDEWIKVRPAFDVKLSKKAMEVLGLSETATRTEVLKAAKIAKRMDLFCEFNFNYENAMARQHDCKYVLTEYGVRALR